jgi:hypothetical protein
VPPVHAAFAALFEVGRTFEYATSVFVDPHASEPIDRTPDRGTLVCRVAEVKTWRGALGARVACEAPRGAKGEVVDAIADNDLAFLWTQAGLHFVEGWPASEAEAARAAKEAPAAFGVAPAALQRERSSEAAAGVPQKEGEAVTREKRRVGGTGGRGGNAEKSVGAWCRVDFSTGFYGRREVRCFAEGMGMVARESDGRAGPSEERWRLVKTGR